MGRSADPPICPMWGSKYLWKIAGHKYRRGAWNLPHKFHLYLIENGHKKNFTHPYREWKWRDSVTLWLCHSVTLSLCDSVTLWLCDSVTLSLCHSVTLWLCDFVTLWLCDSVCNKRSNISAAFHPLGAEIFFASFWAKKYVSKKILGLGLVGPGAKKRVICWAISAIWQDIGLKFEIWA